MTELYKQFYKDLSSDAAKTLSSTLMGQQKTSQQDIKNIRELFNHFYEKYDGPQSANLASMAFSQGIPLTKANKLNDIFDALYEYNNLSRTDTLPLVLVYARMDKVPTKSEVKQLTTFHKNLYKHSSVGNIDATIMLTMFKIIKLNPTQSDLQQAKDVYSEFYKESGVSSTAAAIMTGAIILTGKNKAFVPEMFDTWKKMYEEPGVSSEDAASIVLKITITKHGVEVDPQMGNLVEQSLSSVSSSVSDSTSVISLTQGAITGDFINLDGNPFTPW